MHSWLIVLVDHEEGDSSLIARKMAYSLLEQEGFVGSPGMFSSPPSDWYVIGGRYSGFLVPYSLDEGDWRIYQYEAEKVRKGLLKAETPEEREEMRREMDNVPLYLFPSSFVPRSERDAFTDFGYEDDASVLTEEIWDRLISQIRQYPWEGSSVEDLWHRECYVVLGQELEGKLVKEDAIGNYWVVVVDFHW